MQDEDNSDEYFEIAKEKPSLLLEGEKPRLIDEWQDIPSLWNAVKINVDKTGLKGQFILTGSATPNEENKNKKDGKK